MTYRKIRPGDPLYPRIQVTLALGQWICDAIEHNNADGCPNPTCFNYNPAVQELEQFIVEEFVDVMRRRGHKINFHNGEIQLERV